MCLDTSVGAYIKYLFKIPRYRNTYLLGWLTYFICTNLFDDWEGGTFFFHEIELLRATDWYWDAIGDISVHD